MKIKTIIRKTAELSVSVTALGVLLVACGGNETLGPTTPIGGGAGTPAATPIRLIRWGVATGPNISGVAVKGAMNLSTVNVYAVDATGVRGALLGTGTTSASGVFSLTLSSVPTTPILVEITGGSYVSEKDGTTIVASKPFHALLSSVTAGASGVAVTPLSDIAYAHASAHPASGILAAITAANTFVSKTFGLTADPTSVIPVFTTTALNGKTDAGKMALAIVALDGLATKIASGVPGVSRDDVYDAISSDYADELPDGKNAKGLPIKIVGATPSVSAVLPVTTLGNDFAAELAGANPVAFAGTGAASAVAGLAPSMGTKVTSIVPSSVLTATGVSSSSSGAMSYASIAGKQYLFIAARNKGVRKIDVTDPAAPVELTAPAWNGAALTANTGFAGKPIGGAMVVSSATGVQILAFAYGAKHMALLDPNSGNVIYEGDLPLAATSPIGFSGGSAYIAGAIPDPGKGAWLATADGYVYFDINATIAAGAGATPVLGASKYTAGTPHYARNVAENLGGDIARNLLFTPNYGGISIQMVANQSGGLAAGSYTLDTAYASAAMVSNSNMDGGSVDTGWGVGIISYEDTRNVSFINLNGLTTGAVAGTFKPIATNGFADVNIATMGWLAFSGTSVDSKTHQVFGMAGYSNDIFVGQLQDPATVATGSKWSGMSDWVYYTLPAYSYATDPHANVTVYNVKTGKTYAYLLDGSFSPSGVQQIDVSAMLAMPRAGTTGDAVHQPASNPTLTGGPINKIPLL